MEEWTAREPERGSLEVDPTQLASLLGKLVFSSQVVRGGRVYMQGMLAAFKGLVVDWRRGAVSPVGGKWGAMTVGAPFWRDLRWWRVHLARRGLAPFEKPKYGEGVLSGTDASEWGTGLARDRSCGWVEAVRSTGSSSRRRRIGGPSTGGNCWASGGCARLGASGCVGKCC
jgi:hypothetical protein